MGREEAIIRNYYKAWEADGGAPDLEKIVASFAPGGSWQVLYPTGPRYQGHDALRTELLRQAAFVSNFTIEVLHVASNADVVMIEHVDTFLRNDVRVRACVMSVFELDADGLITENRDYFDSADLGGQAGEDTSTPDWMAG
jgi:limonene-1,2-epoxide hydrolase